MVRSTRTSAAVKNSAPSAAAATLIKKGSEEEVEKEEQKDGASPPVKAGVETSEVVQIGEASTSSGSSRLLTSNLKLSVMLEKLPVEQINPPTPSGATRSSSPVAPAKVLTSAKKGGRGRNKPGPAGVRATRSVRRTSVALEQDDSNDDGLVELIEIVDDDSKSMESISTPTDGSDSAKVEVEFENVPCAVLVKNISVKNVGNVSSKQSSKKDHSADTAKKMESEPKAGEDVEIKCNDLEKVISDKKSDEDDASSSVSSGGGPQSSQEGSGEGDKSPKAAEPVSATRKSKRQVKVTNKFKDFVVDAPLPSSQVPYADVKLARSSNPGGSRKRLDTFSSSDDFSPADSPPPTLVHPPMRTYSNRKVKTSSSEEEKPKKRFTRAGTPVSKEFRNRKKKEIKATASTVSHPPEVDDETYISLSGPEDRNDSTLTVNMDSSYFSDEDAFYYDSPSPEEFCGWPEEELVDLAAAGPSSSTISSMMSFSSIHLALTSAIATAAQPVEQNAEEDTSGVEEEVKTKVLRRGRSKSVSRSSPVVSIEETARPAGSTFIKRSYKTPRKTGLATAGSFSSIHSTSVNSLNDIEVVAPPAPPHPVEEPKPVEPEPMPVDEPEQPMDTSAVETEADDVLEGAMEIVLQADEIIIDDGGEPTPLEQVLPTTTPPMVTKPLRGRRRIRGGNRASPADGPLRRGRSRKDTDVDECDSCESVVKEEEIVLIKVEDVPEEKMEVDTPAAEPVAQVKVEPEAVVAEQRVPEEEIKHEPISVKHEESVEKSPRKSPKKSKAKTDLKETKRDSSSESKSRKPKEPAVVPVESKATPDVEPVKEAPVKIESVSEPLPQPEKVDVVLPEMTKEVPLKEETSAENNKEVVPSVDEQKPPKEEATPKLPKESKKSSSKESKDSRKDPKKSKESRDRSSETSKKDRKDPREESKDRKDKSGKDRSKDKDRKRSSESSIKKDKRSEGSESEKKRHSVKESSGKKAEVDKKQPQTPVPPPPAEKKLPEKPEPEKKEAPSKPATPVPKVSEKPKKCFDSELQALDPTPKSHGKEESKRSKDQDKSHKSEKHKQHRSSESVEAKRKSVTKEKVRSTDSSPAPTKHSSSETKKSSKESSSSSSKSRDSSRSSKIRKSVSSRDDKSREESSTGKKEKVKEKSSEIVVTAVEVKTEELSKEPIKEEEVQIKEELPPTQEIKPIATELPPPPPPSTPPPAELPRIVTKASLKMYQNDEEISIASSSQESVASEKESELTATAVLDASPAVKDEPKEEPAQEEEEFQQISEAFDASVQISGPRPEVALKEFQNISLVEEPETPVEEPPPPPPPQVPVESTIVDSEDQSMSLETSQDLSLNDDSNSNNSSTMDSIKDGCKAVTSAEVDDANIRRSSRIKTISSQKQRTSGHGLVKDKDKFLKKTTISMGIDSKVLKDAVTGNFNVISASDSAANAELQNSAEQDPTVTNIELSEEYLRDMEEKLSRFETIRENMYHCDKVISKEAKKMTCDCFLTNEEIDRGELGCGEDCLNKLLMIECGSRCVVGERCTNKRFQKLEYSNCQVFRTEKKGFGIQASTEIMPGEFVMEYVGEVLNSEQFEERAELYSKEKNKHYYFMALRSDAIIDATTKGNISRFINHSCDPNAETQKWTVNGELRIGFFATKYILPGEEITFDYQFQRYGRKAQKCYCEAECCTGWIGGDPGSDGESEYEEEEEVEESEEEEEVPPETVPSVEVVPSVEDLDKPEELKKLDEEAKPQIEGEPEAAVLPLPVPEVTAVVKPPEPKPKKVIRKRIERPKIRRIQIYEDPDLEKEINHLLKTGLKNQAQTLKLSRLMVRAKDIKSRSRLLTILQSGELPCRRLFLDYHGLQLLYGWICESTESIEDLKFRIQILDTLDRLPIPNKTMLKDSKILQTIEKWAKIEKSKEEKKEKEKEVEKEKEASSTGSPSDSNGTGSDSNTSSSDAKKQEVVGSAEVLKNMPELLKIADLGKLKEIISSTCVEKESAEKEKPSSSVISEPIPSTASLIDSIEIPEPEDENAPEEKRLGTQIRILSCKLLISWINLKEVFRIPKKERIEQMKEHEREADLRYKALGLGDDDESSLRHSSSRFFDRTRDLKRRKSVDDRELLNYKMKRPLGITTPMSKMDHLSKQQRRQLFEMKVAHEEAERRNKELWMQHENSCLKFGLNPHLTAPMDIPAKMNPATGEYFSADDRLLPTPPSHVYFKVLPPPMPTNPDDYELPPMDLPKLWKFAIDERGKLYYYHVRDRIPQWEPPKKDNPNGRGAGLRDEDISMSSDSSTTDTEDSEEEYLNGQLEQLMKKKKKQQSSFNLDDVLAKPDDMNDDLSKTIKDLETGDSSPQASSSGEKLFGGDSFEKTAEELLQHRKRKHSNKLVQEKIISPRTEEDKLYGQMEMKRYKETKEKLRRRKEEAKRLRARSMLDKSLSDSPFSTSFSGDGLDRSATENSLIDDDLVVSHKIVEDKCIVDELDILTKKKKISPYEEWQKVKQRLGKKRAAKPGESSTFGGSSSSTSTSLGSSSSSSSSSKHSKRKSKLDLNSDEARRIKEKFRGEIAGVIVQHLSAYRKESCQSGRITNTEDFKHLARKLTHFVLVKELKHCDNTINELEVTDSVRTKAREFIKKYMAKHGSVYVRGDNEPDYANINL